MMGQMVSEKSGQKNILIDVLVHVQGIVNRTCHLVRLWLPAPSLELHHRIRKVGYFFGPVKEDCRDQNWDIWGPLPEINDPCLELTWKWTNYLFVEDFMVFLSGPCHPLPY